MKSKKYNIYFIIYVLSYVFEFVYSNLRKIKKHITDEYYAESIADKFNDLYSDNFLISRRYGLSYPYEFNDRLWYKIKNDSLLNENIKFKEVDL